VPVHPKCNASFSPDEEYFTGFLASVISGSTEPDPQEFRAASGSLRRNPGLRARIGQSRRIEKSLWGDSEILWKPESERVNRVLVKNAKGHAFYELGEPMLSEPFWVGADVLPLLPESTRNQFEHVLSSSFLPEVGSRMLQRIAKRDLQPGGWVEVQPDVYRYAICQTGTEILVRIVLREYLAVEVAWTD
jgi:hypothetical protein